ncbi:MAG: hypothetical protein ABMB14_35220 [Myxococcota bacterium]
MVFAEAASDARVLKAVVEGVLWTEGPQWVREHLEYLGSEHLFRWTGEDDVTACVTWPRVKTLAAEHRVRIGRRGEGGAVTEIRKALALAAQLWPTASVVVHRDRDVVEGDLVRLVGDDVMLAIPNPCTEAWLLRAADHPVPPTSNGCKDAVARAGIDDPDAMRQLLRQHPARLVGDPAGVVFLEQVRRQVLSRLHR